MRVFLCLLLPSLVALVLGKDLSPVVEQLDLSGETSGLVHLRRNSETGQLYVGAVNRIYQLSTDLGREAEVVTGPVQDSPLCPAAGCERGADTEPTDNVNKVLVLDRESRTLLACGSVLQGACVKYELNNISRQGHAIPRAIAANDANSSTVAFIGPEHYHPWGVTNVLYVATTFTLVGDYRNNVPAISTRSLQDLDFAERSVNKHSMMTIDVKYRDHLLVDYVYGFPEGDYAYFLTVQRRSHLPGQHEQGYVSRIVRTCITDANYDSYVEMTLSCDGDTLLQAARLAEAGQDLAWGAHLGSQRKVLVAAFSPSQGFTNQPEQSSRVCAYSMKDIERKFNENIHMCFNGSMKYRNMEYISGPILNGKCPKAGSVGNIQHFCTVGLKISALRPLRAEPAVSFEERVTSVAVTTTGPHTVLLLGTEHGTLRKAVLTSLDAAVTYAEVTVDAGAPILRDALLDGSHQHLYTLSQLKVSKVRVQTCEVFTNCSACLYSRDPYCGWCSLERRCTVQQQCRAAQSSPPRWITAGAGQRCIDMERVEPPHLALTQQAQVVVQIRSLPALPPGAKYRCVFGTAPPIDASATPEGLRCPAPPEHLRPRVPPSADHVTVPLSVRSSETSKDFVSRPFVFFDCGRHAQCSACVTSRWPCSWCVHESRCVLDLAGCRGDVVTRSSNKSVSAVELGCPAVVPPHSPLLVASSVSQPLVLEVRNLPTPLTGPVGYTCTIEVESSTTRVSARVDARRFIVCDRSVYEYLGNTSQHTASVTVHRQPGTVIGSTSLTLYKCELLATHQGTQDCSLCLTRDPAYRCQWCGGQCRYSEQCRQTPASECPRPYIQRISPASGPLEGGTLLTIEGRNLGLRRGELQQRLFVGHVPCQLVNFQVSVKVTCRTGAVPRPTVETVRLGNNAGLALSNWTFHYKPVRVETVYPRLGPRSGGTVLTLTGSNLHVGSNLTVLLDRLPCLVTSRRDRVTCVTSPARQPENIERITIIVDGATLILNKSYSYTPDPLILEIQPLRSFVAGGRVLTVHGRRLDSVQAPRLVVLNNTDLRPINSTSCVVISGELMECLSPTVPELAPTPGATPEAFTEDSARAFRGQRPPGLPQAPEAFSGGSVRPSRLRRSHGQQVQQHLRLGFMMDGVESVRDIQQFFPSVRATITYVSDPVFFPFANDVKTFSGDTLVIEGVHLNAASDERDTAVTVGGANCNVTTLTSTQLVCVPPRQQPPAADDAPSPLPMVVVSVGNLRFPLGRLQYETAGAFKLGAGAIAAAAAGGALLVLASLLILAVYRRKSTQTEREYKRIQIQMDTLENNIRSECKQAFAAMCTWDSRRERDPLAAAGSDLSAQLSGIADSFRPEEVDCLSQREFLVKVLFPGVSEHPILDNRAPALPGSPQLPGDIAAQQLEQLLRSPSFLTAVVDAMEQQKDFSVRDRVTVASLLTVILMTNMEYMTSVLRQLLARHITRISRSKHPHLMLRRTETVVEKLLTNWMSVCLYGHIRDRLAPPLYLLTKAVKHQMSSGPVDAITLEAHYSLAEERLLRQQVPHRPVTLLVTAEEAPYESLPGGGGSSSSQPRVYEAVSHKVTVQALDCDSISQVKQKVIDAVFCGLPASQRPSHHCVALDLLRPDGQRVPLADEDASSVVVDGWRRLNILSHYGVGEVAAVAMVQARETARTARFPTPSTSSSVTSSFSPLVSSNIYVKPGTAVRAYHLVRPTLPPGEDGAAAPGTLPRAAPEVFLTRMLSSKALLQRFIDGLLSALLSRESAPPLPPVKWLYDLLDREATAGGVDDPDTLHSWKANCLPLRMWANLIRRPELVFDLDKSPAVESTLIVISQSLVEACLPTPPAISKHSPSHKLVFAKDIARWQSMVGEYFEWVRAEPGVSEQEWATFLHQLSRHHAGMFDCTAALKELHLYINKYREPISEALDSNSTCQQMLCSQRLADITASMDVC